jgi:hypothetical protein
MPPFGQMPQQYIPQIPGQDPNEDPLGWMTPIIASPNVPNNGMTPSGGMTPGG